MAPTVEVGRGDGPAEEAATDGTRATREAQDAVLAGAGAAVGGLRGVRPEVLASWSRCHSFGLDPDAARPPVELAGDDLLDYRDRHPLGVVMPVVRELLVTPITDEDLIVAVSDVDGTLLWVEGSRGARHRAEGMQFTEGARWDERHAGTNAPGLALATGHPVRVVAAEHWARPVQPWSCCASLVHDPADGRLLGAVDVTGDARAAARGVLALVTATVAAAERELEISRLRRPAAGPGPRGTGPGERAPLRLAVLSADGPVLAAGGRRLAVSLRHAELLLLLAEHPDGLSADALAVELDERALDPVTVRVEMSRLRRIVGPDVLRSRPYRLAVPIATDVANVRRLLASEDLRSVLGMWSGQLLPRSQAPGVARLRARLREETRVALLRRADPVLLLRWADGPASDDDVELWEACRQVLPPGPDRDRATARVRLLDRELGC